MTCEYYCEFCGQLRLYVPDGKPRACGQCGSTRIDVDAVGSERLLRRRKGESRSRYLDPSSGTSQGCRTNSAANPTDGEKGPKADMDPNQTRAELIALVNTSRAALDSSEGITPLELAERLDRLCELVSALDTWLQNGGFKPDAWMSVDD